MQQTYHHGNLREAMLDAVAEIVVDGGVEAVSLRAAARRVGVSHAAPTHHFGDKRGLLTAFATRGFERFTDALTAARAAAPAHVMHDAADAPDTALVACGHAYVEFALAERHYFAVMFRPELVDWSDPDLRRAGDASFGVLLEVVAGCREGGAATDPETRRLALAAWAMVHGLAHLLVDGPLAGMAPGLSADSAYAAISPVLLSGLRAEPGWRGPSHGP